MFSQKEADKALGIPPSTMRDYACRIGILPERVDGLPSWSTGDLVLIKVARLLVERGYRPAFACSITFQVKGEFVRLTVEEDQGARAWLLWRISDDGEVVSEIFRDSQAALDALEQHPDSMILPVHDLLKRALYAVLGEVRRDA